MIAPQAGIAAIAYPVFADIDPEILAREEPALASARELLTGAWSDFLRRVLPPMDDAAA